MIFQFVLIKRLKNRIFTNPNPTNSLQKSSVKWKKLLICNFNFYLNHNLTSNHNPSTFRFHTVKINRTVIEKFIEKENNCIKFSNLELSTLQHHALPAGQKRCSAPRRLFCKRALCSTVCMIYSVIQCIQYIHCIQCVQYVQCIHCHMYKRVFVNMRSRHLDTVSLIEYVLICGICKSKLIGCSYNVLKILQSNVDTPVMPCSLVIPCMPILCP